MLSFVRKQIQRVRGNRAEPEPSRPPPPPAWNEPLVPPPVPPTEKENPHVRFPPVEETEERLKEDLEILKTTTTTNDTPFSGQHVFLPEDMVRSVQAKLAIKNNIPEWQLTTEGSTNKKDANSEPIQLSSHQVDDLDVEKVIVTIVSPSELRPDEMIPLDTRLDEDKFFSETESIFTEDEMKETIELAKRILERKFEASSFEALPFVPSPLKAVIWDELEQMVIEEDKLTEAQQKIIEWRVKHPVSEYAILERRKKLERMFRKKYKQTESLPLFKFEVNDSDIPEAISQAEHLTRSKARKEEEVSIREALAKEGEIVTSFADSKRHDRFVLPLRLAKRLENYAQNPPPSSPPKPDEADDGVIKIKIDVEARG